MSSGRSSGRVELATADYLAGGSASAKSRADTSHPAGVRGRGRRQLAQLRSSLSDCDLSVLRSLASLTLARTEHLRRLHFDDTKLTPQSARRQARLTLHRLHQLGLIERLKRRIGGVRAGSSSFVWWLTPAGARLIGHEYQRRSREPSFAHLSHVLAVAELVVQLHEHTRTNHDDSDLSAEALAKVELLSVETEPGCWRRYVGHHGAVAMLKPDLRVTLGVGAHELHWFVEVDRGTEGPTALKRQITSYVNAWRDGAEQTRAGVFPRVLWVVPDGKRADVITEVCDTVPGVPEGMFATAVTERAVQVLTSYPEAGGASAGATEGGAS